MYCTIGKAVYTAEQGGARAAAIESARARPAELGRAKSLRKSAARSTDPDQRAEFERLAAKIDAAPKASIEKALGKPVAGPFRTRRDAVKKMRELSGLTEKARKMSEASAAKKPAEAGRAAHEAGMKWNRGRAEPPKSSAPRGVTAKPGNATDKE